MQKPPKSLKAFAADSFLSAGDTYLEDLYDQYLSHPEKVTVEWRHFFENLSKSAQREHEYSHASIRKEIKETATTPAGAIRATPSVKEREYQHEGVEQERITELINAYRRHGHLQAQTDPLELRPPVDDPTLSLNYYGYEENDLDTTFSVENFPALSTSSATLRTIYNTLRKTYCGSIGFEYMYINRSDEVKWVQAQIEQRWANFNISVEEKKSILEKLVAADSLEKYLGFKYVGQKRFSLEGGDGLIPLLATIVNRSVRDGVKEAAIGMAHRGRLNVLVNIVGKNPKAIFEAFEGKGTTKSHFSGDVKYHLGYSSDIQTPHGPAHMVLAFNPSHLEIVSPVVQGSVRARQRRRRDTPQVQVLPIQIHGEAAFAGQGVVSETFNMSQTRWFTVGGSIHIVINNQVGFTISDIRDSRSTYYCTDVAKMIEPPILHVNGNDPEAVYFAAQFAVDYREKFKRDVVIDLICYRRQGHNEADEPSATQPIMYKKIRALPVPYQIYAQKLIQEGVITAGTEKKLADDYRAALDEGKQIVQLADKESEYLVNWQPFESGRWDESVNTGVPIETLRRLANNLEKLPEGFVLQAQVKKMWDAQKKMSKGSLPLNWGYAETLAYATLLDEGYPIRLCGQDSARGTFAHRHAVLHDQNTDEIYIPLSHVSERQAQINIVDSLLSENAVLAFEYGYSTTEPNFLVIWEAQFGDFANGAQVVIDQFISSGEQKWGRLCGLVMLLPHGYEGMGPEHSSARLERYLQLCAQDNMQVCVPTLPSQIFHLLRRQMIRPYRKPLIVMSPKGFLRHPQAISTLEDLASKQYQLVIPEVETFDKKNIKTLIFCCGKIYYHLIEKRTAQKLNHVAIVRVEQLYPFPEEAVIEALSPYRHVKDIVWCQEEPRNQGAWFMMQSYLANLLAEGQVLRYAGRPEAASPAVGYHQVHEEEQQSVVEQALTK